MLDELRDYLSDALPALLAEHGVPGAVVAAYAGGGQIEYASGVLNRSTGVAATVDSLFQIGSITKLWTATLIMQLMEAGRLELDTPVRRYLPDFRLADEHAASVITPRQLLCHTAGFDGDIFTDTGPGDDCLRRFVDELAHVQQIVPPGHMFSYNNAAFCVLGRIIESLHGAPYEQCLRKYLIEPLGLTHVATGAHEAILHRAAVGHLRPADAGEAKPAAIWSLPRSIGPAGGMLAMRARDLIGFARLHLSNGIAPDGSQILSAGSVMAMQESQVQLPCGSMSTDWGLGWEICDRPGVAIIGHDGGTIGQSAYLQVVPGRDVAIVLLANGGDDAALYRDLFGHTLRELADIELPTAPTPPHEQSEVDAERYLGRYQTEFAEQSVTRDDSGRIWLRVTPRSAIAKLVAEPQQVELVHYATDTFISAQPVGYRHRLVGFGGADPSGRAEYVVHDDRAARRVAPPAPYRDPGSSRPARQIPPGALTDPLRR